MFDKLGAKGIVGVLALLGGIAVIASVHPLIAGGMALIVLGLGLVVWGVVSSMLSNFGMGGMMGGGGMGGM